MFVSVDAKSNLRDCREVVGVLCVIVREMRLGRSTCFTLA